MYALTPQLFPASSFIPFRDGEAAVGKVPVFNQEPLSTVSHGLNPAPTLNPPAAIFVATPLSSVNLLDLQDYVVDLSSSHDQRQFVCQERSTGEKLTARVYDMESFQLKAQLLLFDLEGVMKVKDVKTWNDKVFVISGRQYGDLHHFLRKKKRLSESQAAPLFKQIVTLVRNAHANGLALRDLKLKKFVFNSEERNHLVLNNLEDAQFLERGGNLSDRHGCPAYICPEMLHPGDYSGQAADLWSLGVILYTLLVGHYPFFDSNPQNLFSKIRSGYYSIPDYISYTVRPLISSLLTFDPSNRVNANGILDHPWFKHAPNMDSSPAHFFSDQTVPKFVDN